MRDMDYVDMDCVDTEYVDLLQENALLRETAKRARNDNGIYAHIAYALARDYTDLFYVNVETGEFIEYYSDDVRGMLLERRRATGFFESCEREAKLFVHQDDQDMFVTAMNREFLSNALDDSDEFEMTYRRIKDDRTFWVQMRVSRMRDDDSLIVVAVSDIDELVKKRRAEERIREERIVYARLHAITDNFVAVYVVNPKTEQYHEFSSSDYLEQTFAVEKEGDDFFGRAREVTCRYIHPADLIRFLASFSRENVLATVERDGIYTLGYRLMMGDGYRHVQIKVAMVEEDKGSRLVVGLNDIDAQVRQETETERRLAQAQAQANIDALTGVKNKHAYMEAEAQLNQQIASQQVPPFAIVVLDVNDLKKVNDVSGHQAGDQYLRNACKIVCDAFKHSPVFRVGGDEFAVIARGADLAQLEERIWDLSVRNEEALRSGDVVIACGMARYEGDESVAAVFERADQRMYKDKEGLKLQIADEE